MLHGSRIHVGKQNEHKIARNDRCVFTRCDWNKSKIRVCCASGVNENPAAAQVKEVGVSSVRVKNYLIRA